MRSLSPACRRTLVLAGLLVAAPLSTAWADSPFAGCQNERVLPFKGLFSATLNDLKRLPTAQTAAILSLGAAGAVAAHPADRSFSKDFSGRTSLEETFEPGAIVGGMPAQVGAAFLTYGLGRAFHNQCIAAVGGELVQAQLISQLLTYSIKGTVRRARPEGGGFSFPSGHTTSAFASATVLQRHFGWKVGAPAYAAATYVAASRIQGKRHYLSDVAFGAALGIVAGRTVTMPGGHKMALGAIGTDFGPAAGFTLLGKK
jgi:membrane-associated phospholipid phosphatase